MKDGAGGVSFLVDSERNEIPIDTLTNVPVTDDDDKDKEDGNG
jgi:hypothetical protein